jgi:hypothetical protein
MRELHADNKECFRFGDVSRGGNVDEVIKTDKEMNTDQDLEKDEPSRVLDHIDKMRHFSGFCKFFRTSNRGGTILGGSLCMERVGRISVYHANQD